MLMLLENCLVEMGGEGCCTVAKERPKRFDIGMCT